MNDAKTPSLKNNEDLFERIAAFLLYHASESSVPVLEKRYRLDDPLALQAAIEAELMDAYSMSTRSQDTFSELEVNAYCMPKGSLRDKADIFNKAIVRSAEKKNTDSVHCYTSSPISSYHTKNNVLSNSIFELAKADGLDIIIHQFVDTDDFAENINRYCAAICNYADNVDGFTFHFYKSDFEIDPRLLQFAYIEDELMSLLVRNPLSQTDHLIICTDPEAISSSHFSIARKIHQSTKLLRDRAESSIPLNHFLYDFIMEDKLRYFLNVMQPIYMCDDFIAKIFRTYLPHVSDDEFRVYVNSLCSRSQREVIIYRSALLDYFYSGKAFVFENMLAIQRKDRIQHLEQILENMKKGDSKLTIIDDDNPIIDRKNAQMSFYLTKEIGYAMTFKKESRILLFNSHQLVSGFNTFFDNIQKLDSRYILTGEEAEDFIRRGMMRI